MTLDKFFTKYNGRFIDYDKAYGFQCVDLARQYILEVLGFKPYVALPAGATAKVIFQNFKSNAYFTKVLNTPSGVPKKGDIIFWGWRWPVTGSAGHVAIFMDGNVNRFISLDQNYPSRLSVKLVNHSYIGVLGWLTPAK